MKNQRFMYECESLKCIVSIGLSVCEYKYYKYTLSIKNVPTDIIYPNT